MTTIADAKKMAVSLLASNSDLGLAGRLIVVKPVRHFVRGIIIARTSSPQDFHPAWALDLLCRPKQSFSLNCGYRFGPSTHGLWSTDWPDLAQDFARKVEADILPNLRSMDSFEKCYEVGMHTEFPFGNMSNDRWGGMFPMLANNDFSQAEDFCERFFIHRRCAIGHAFDDAETILFQRLIPMIYARDRTGIAILLHELEWKTVQKLKIEKFWEKTPFPLELA